MLEIELQLCRLDQFSIGITTGYGECETGEFQILTFGFLFVELNFIKYY
ncbi:hypothetical protein T190820D02B_10341 [Tenacibaculum sp. 190524A05c]